MIDAETLDAIAACGYDVYQSSGTLGDNYLFFTDGTNIGYMQNDRLYGYRMTSVHQPCRECGTGFGIDGPVTFTRECLQKAFDCVPPHFASQTMRNAVRKWPDMETFLNRQRGLIYNKVRSATT